MPLLLPESDVHSLLPMPELIDAMQSALAGFSSGRVVQPVRSAFEYAPKAYFGLMPAYDPDSALVGAKLLTFIPGNLDLGIPTHQALIALFHPERGDLLALVDGRYITEARTAAVSSVSVRCLAREDAATLAIIGSGVQAHSHLEALRQVRVFRDTRVWSPTHARLMKFVEAEGDGVRAVESAGAAIRGADVVVLATGSATPVIRDEWVAPGTHVISVGACRPTMRELDPALIAHSLMVVDSRAAAVVESGDIIHTGCAIHAELGEIAEGTRPGRTSPTQITIFKSLGMGIEDVVSAGLAYRRALEQGRGTQFTL